MVTFASQKWKITLPATEQCCQTWPVQSELADFDLA